MTLISEFMTKILSHENNPMKVLEEIKAEFSEISKDTSLIQKAITSAETREICFGQIKELASKVEGNAMDKPTQTILEEKINHLRILTIHSIECIIQWKQHIESLSGTKRIEFRHNGLNYFTKIKSDYDELKSSLLKGVYTFS